MFRSSDAAADSAAAQRPTEGTPNGEGRHIPGIDGLRAVAILIVMASHAGLGWLIPGGFGVTIFFFLSGYLITTLLRIERQRSGTVHLRAFYFRRAVRILPPLYLTLLLVMVLGAAGLIRAPLNAHSLGLDIMFLTNYASVLGVWATTPIPLWSLDVEEHFYLFFPALFMILTKYNPGGLTPTLLIICVAVFSIRLSTFLLIGPANIYFWSHTRIDSIMFGALLAIWHNPVIDQNAWRPKLIHVIGALSITMLTFAIRSPLFRETIRYSLQGIALFVLFSSVVQTRGLIAKVLNGSAMRVVALLSYTLYLVHSPLLEATTGLPQQWSVAVAYTLALLWAGMVYLAVERPLAQWRRRSLDRAAGL